MSYGTPQPGDDAQLRAWRRRYAEDTERGFSLRLPLALARRLRAEAARGVPHSRYAADLLRAALGDLPGGPALAAVPPPTAGAPGAPDAPDAPPPNARGQVDLRTLRVIQLREGRAGTPPRAPPPSAPPCSASCAPTSPGWRTATAARPGRHPRITDDTTPTTRDITHEQGQPRVPADGDGPTDTPLGPGPVGPARPRLGPEEWRATQEIATGLGETERGPLGQVGRVVGRLGAERARAFLARTQDIEAAGGLLLPDGSRRRTPGGTFFHLVRTSDEVSREDRTSIFPPLSKRPKKTAGGNASATPALAGATAPTPAAWTDDIYREMMAALQQEPGEPGRATTVKITVIGRPGTAVEQGQAVVLALTSEKVPDLPKGLPEPPAGTRYTVFVARKPWGKVAEALAADPEDAAIIEGYAALDPRVEGIAVYATSATTKRLQAAKRVAQEATP